MFSTILQKCAYSRIPRMLLMFATQNITKYCILGRVSFISVLYKHVPLLETTVHIAQLHYISKPKYVLKIFLERNRRGLKFISGFSKKLTYTVKLMRAGVLRQTIK